MNLNDRYVYSLKISERLKAFDDADMLVAEDPLFVDEKWFNVKSLMDRQLFYEKLKLLNITKEQFAFALKDYSEYELIILKDYLKRQDWFIKYQDIMKDFKDSYTDTPVENEQLVLPFKKYLEKRLSSLNFIHINIETVVITKLCQNIVNYLSKLTWKCLVIELHEYKKNNKLSGETSHDRYVDFLSKNYGTINQIELFYIKYPVLARLITQKLLDLTLETEIMLQNLDNYYTQISDALGLDNNHILEIISSQGDTHNRGKSVTKIVLENNSTIFYKPRNCYIEKAFHEFVKYINEETKLKDLFINKVYYASDFTVENFVKSKSCDTSDEVKEFYYRFGEILAIVSILQGTDLHSENVIAVNKYPVIIDFETFFSQLSLSAEDEEYLLENKKDDDFLNLTTTALLPLYGLNNNLDHKGIDVSALTGGNSELIPKKVLMITELYTDNMHYEYLHITKKQDNNKPKLNEEEQDYKRYKEDIYSGFHDTLDYFYQNKLELSNIIKTIFDQIEVRQVIKATAIYADLLSYIDHPNYLQNMIYLERLLDNSFAYPHKNKRIVQYEIEDLSYIEIPIFYTNVSNTYLMNSNKQHIINDYYKECSLKNVLSNINKLTDTSINREQLKLKILLGDYPKLIEKRLYHLSKQFVTKMKKSDYTEDEVLYICSAICNTLMTSAYYSKNKKNISWRHIDTKQEYPVITFMGDDLYSGKSGIFLYMHYMSIVKKERNDIKNFSELLYNRMKLSAFHSIEIDPSVYYGNAAILYSFISLGQIDEKLINNIKEFLIELQKAPKSKSIDWLGGITGYISLLCKINMLSIEEKITTALLENYTSYLIDFIHSNKNEIGSFSIGFGHGEIGMIYALLISQSILHKDFRNEIEILMQSIDDKLNHLEILNDHSWCNGMVGLGIGAIACKKYMVDSRLDQYISLTYNAMNQTDPINMCLCHGLCGEINFLLSMTQLYPNRSEIRDTLKRKVCKIISVYNEDHTVLLYELPEFPDFGLYTGLTGIGMTLLRVVYGDKIPNFLLLE